jgi:hypothetical protein
MKLQKLQNLGIPKQVLKRSTHQRRGLFKYRFDIEHVNSLGHQYRRLKVWFERGTDILEVFIVIAYGFYCFRVLNRSSVWSQNEI